MPAVLVVLLGQLRRRWRSWLAIALLISLVSGVVVAAVAAGRRTQSAFPAFVASSGFDAQLYSTTPFPSISSLPGVTEAIEGFGLDNGQPICACTHALNPNYFGVLALPTKGAPLFNLVSGRLPDPTNPDEVVASYTLQQNEGLHVGSVIRVPFYAASQASAYDTAEIPPKPMGPTVPFRVVGFGASEFDFPTGGTPQYTLYTSRAFSSALLPKIATGYGYFVRLRHGAADLPRFTSAATARQGTAYTENEDAQVASVEASIHPQALGWWLLALLAALVGLAVIGQVLARQTSAESQEYPTMVALGIERRQLVLLASLRNLMVGLAGAVGGVAVATLLSPIAPLGEARFAESWTGVRFDALVLPIGALVTVALVVALGLWPAIRAGRAGPTGNRIVSVTPSRTASRLWSLGAPPSVVIGVRNALDRRVGGASVPVGSALLATVLAVVALCGTAVFGASLTHLTTTPALYGDPFQLNISDPNSGGTPDPMLVKSLEHDRAIARITEGIALPAISINRVVVGALAGTAIRGPLLMTTVLGHSPNAPGEIGLGATTMREVGAHIGEVVRVTVSPTSRGRQSAPFLVVAQMSLPVAGDAVSLGSGAVLTLAGYEDAACPPGPARPACQQRVRASANGGILASVVPGPKGRAAVNRYINRYPTLATIATAPTSLVNFGEAVNFPLIFGAVLALFGTATLLHLLVVTVSRRRREIGLLKVLGFVNGQVVSVVSWQATTLAVVAIAIGIPLGIVIGRDVWHAFANNLGAVPVSVMPIWLISLLAVGVLTVANLIAIAPALVARNSKPGDLLREASYM